MGNKVALNIPQTDRCNEPSYTMFINGKPLRIAKDVDVEVPPFVKDIYRECDALDKKANKNDPKTFVKIEM